MSNTDFTFDMGPVVATVDPDVPWEDVLIPNPACPEAPQIGSFAHFLNGHYPNEAEAVLERALYEKRIPIGRTCSFLCDPDYVFVNEMQLVRRFFTCEGRNKVGIHTVYRTRLTLTEELGGRQVSEQVEQWYQLDGEAELCDGDYFVDLVTDIHIYEKELAQPQFQLSDYLVPIIYKEQLDTVASKLLQEYCPEYLDAPAKVNVKRLVEKLGLTILSVKLPPEENLLGKLYFQADTVTAVDDAGQRYQKSVPANTILLNLADGGKGIRWTILHECIHYMLHYLFYLSQHLYNEELRFFARKASAAADDAERTPIQWIEWQANQLVPRMLMPAEPTRKKIEELMRRYEKLDHMACIEKTIRDLSSFYDVSLQCAKYRMVELGYSEASGAQTYVNGRKVPAYHQTDTSETYSVSIADILETYDKDPAFRKLINSGEYLYVESHFCRNDPKYLCLDTMELTDYARKHIQECCLSFTVHGSQASYTYQDGSLQRSQPPAAHIVDFNQQDCQTKQETLVQSAVRISNILLSLPGTFGLTLTAHMERLSVSREDLAEFSQVSVRTIQRYRTDDEANLTLSNVVAICIGLHLEPALSMDLISKAGLGFRVNKTHQLYQIILTSMYMSDIDTCNEVLVTNGLKPLAA